MFRGGKAFLNTHNSALKQAIPHVRTWTEGYLARLVRRRCRQASILVNQAIIRLRTMLPQGQNKMMKNNSGHGLRQKSLQTLTREKTFPSEEDVMGCCLMRMWSSAMKRFRTGTGKTPTTASPSPTSSPLSRKSSKKKRIQANKVLMYDTDDNEFSPALMNTLNIETNSTFESLKSPLNAFRAMHKGLAKSKIDETDKIRMRKSNMTNEKMPMKNHLQLGTNNKSAVESPENRPAKLKMDSPTLQKALPKQKSNTESEYETEDDDDYERKSTEA